MRRWDAGSTLEGEDEGKGKARPLGTRDGLEIMAPLDWCRPWLSLRVVGGARRSQVPPHTGGVLVWGGMKTVEGAWVAGLGECGRFPWSHAHVRHLCRPGHRPCTRRDG
jgi:hypothetical protein